MDDRRLVAYWVALLLHITGWGIYYAVSRSLTSVIGWKGLLLLVASETLPSALSIPASEYAVKRGYERLLVFGVPEALGLLLFGYLPWPSKALAVLVASIGWAVAGPQVLNAILEDAEGRGSRLGVALTAGALGWSLGGLVGPLLYSATSLQVTLSIAALLVALCYALLYTSLPGTARKPGGAKASGLAAFIYSLSLSPLILAMEASFAAVMSELSRILTPTEYGLVLAGTGVSSALGKVAVGFIVERWGYETARVVYRFSFIAYSLWMLASAHVKGFLLALLFLTPVYPLYEIGFYTWVSRLLGERRASAVWAASYTISGLGALGISVLGLGFERILLLSSILAIVSLGLVTLVEYWISAWWARRNRG